MQEVMARQGRVIGIATEGDSDLAGLAEDILYVPSVSSFFSLVTTVPLRHGYPLADMKGTDVDQPRNLAKSVTVE